MTDTMNNKVKDTRVAYGAMCTWWGDIREVGKQFGSIPCCPHCRGILFEMSSPEEWWGRVDKFEDNGHPGYHDFIAWIKNKCFLDRSSAKLSYERETEKKVTL